MKHIIITGASRGFGTSVANASAESGTRLHLVARSDMTDLKSELEQKGAEVTTYTADLSKTENSEAWFSEVAENIERESAEAVILYNNAGMLHPIGPIGKYSASDYRKNLEINFVAALMAGHLFVQSFGDYPCIKRVINISSGAARNPYHGWSHYCSTKAGLDMFTRCLSLEQKEQAYPVEALSFSPGPIDTGMQDEIRAKSKDDFANVDKFISLKQSGNLGDPDEAAGVLHKLVWKKDFPDGQILDIMDL